MPRRSAPSSTTRCSSSRPSSRTTAASGPTASSSSTTARPTGPWTFLAAQPDVMVVGSGIRYFAQVAYPPEALARIRETRAVRLWRDQMLDQFCAGQWAVVVDPDEFLALPASLPAFCADARRRRRRGGLGGDGRHVPGAGARHPRQGRRALPPRGRLVLRRASRTSTRPSRARPRRCRAPSIRGACRGSSPPGTSCRRARSSGGSAAGSRATATRRRARSTRRRSSSGAPGDWFLNCHVTSKPVAPRVVPIMHFKFTADLGRKIEYALSTGGYNQGSRSYRLYATLIERMRARDGVLRRPGLAALPGPARLRRCRDRPMNPVPEALALTRPHAAPHAGRAPETSRLLPCPVAVPSSP